MSRPSAVVFCRDPSRAESWLEELHARGFAPRSARGATELLDLARTTHPRVVVLDLDEPAPVLAEVVGRVRRAAPTSATLVSVESEAEATSLLAPVPDVLVVPRSAPPVWWHCALMAASRLAEARGELEELRRLARERFGLEGLVGTSAAMERVREMVERIAPYAEPVWIFGEAGTGKTLTAEILHKISERRERPLLRLTREALGREPPASALEPALDQAATVVVHHVEQLGPEQQEWLMERAGQRELRGVRWVLTSLEEPRRLAEVGRLHPGLLGAFEGPAVHVPPLRQRLEDVPLLAHHFAEELARLNAWPPPRFLPETMQAMQHHAWPGNVRELRQCVEQALLLAGGAEVAPEHLPPKVRPGEAVREHPRTFREAKRDVVSSFERQYLERLMRRHAGNVTAAAREAGMLRSALQRLLRKHHLRSADFRRAASRAPRQARPTTE